MILFQKIILHPPPLRQFKKKCIFAKRDFTSKMDNFYCKINKNETGQKGFKLTNLRYANNVPTFYQFQELAIYCLWEKTSKGIKVTGPNGKSIVLTYTAGHGTVCITSDSDGNYWTATPKDNDKSMGFTIHRDGTFDFTEIEGYRYRAVRLVDDNRKIIPKTKPNQDNNSNSNTPQNNQSKFPAKKMSK